MSTTEASRPADGPGPDGTQTKRRRSLGWSIIALFAITLGIGGANLLFTSSQVSSVAATNAKVARQEAALEKQQAILERQIQADCNVYARLAPLPVTLNITTGRPTLLSVQLISDSRVAWTAKGCTGTLAAPDPSFVKWASFYHLPLN